MNLFKFDPESSDAQLAKGRYHAEIVAAEVRTSKAGNEMLEVTYRVQTTTGLDVVLKDYLVATPRAKWKIKGFCDALGLNFEAGEIDPVTVMGKPVVIDVAVEENPGEPDRNTITDYMPANTLQYGSGSNGNGSKRTPAAAGAASRSADAGGEEQIPF